MTSTETRAFWIEHGEAERYGNYVRMARFEPWTDDDHTVELAVFAWDRATTPVMSPGYVRRHQRILSARLARNDWDGALLAAVEVLFSAPRELHTPLPGDDYWRDWPAEWRFSAEHDVYYEPGGEDLAHGSYLLASASLQFPVRADLPEPGAAGDQGSASAAVVRAGDLPGDGSSEEI